MAKKEEAARNLAQKLLHLKFGFFKSEEQHVTTEIHVFV